LGGSTAGFAVFGDALEASVDLESFADSTQVSPGVCYSDFVIGARLE